MHCIIQPVDGRGGLWLGNLASAKNRSGLDQRGIGAVLTVMSDKEVSFDNSIVQLVTDSHSFSLYEQMTQISNN